MTTDDPRGEHDGHARPARARHAARVVAPDVRWLRQRAQHLAGLAGTPEYHRDPTAHERAAHAYAEVARATSDERRRLRHLEHAAWHRGQAQRLRSIVTALRRVCRLLADLSPTLSPRGLTTGPTAPTRRMARQPLHGPASPHLRARTLLAAPGAPSKAARLLLRVSRPPRALRLS